MKKRRLPWFFGGADVPDEIPQLPQMRNGKKAAILSLIVLFYGGMIVLGVFNYSNDTIFAILLAVLVLLPPLLSYGLLYGMSDHIDHMLNELDKDPDEDEDNTEK